ncbi:MAG: M14 family zinc carboxypeptidase [Xanthomonadales bacterium]|nr:M14 family zinc carboxypeptidase [Xanthomonadales bacterium]
MTPRALLLRRPRAARPWAPRPSEDDPLEMVFPAAERDAAVPHPDRFLAHPLGEAGPHPRGDRPRAAGARGLEPEAALPAGSARAGRDGRSRCSSWACPSASSGSKSLRRELARIEDPRGLGEAERRELLARLPALGYLGFSIHGNETSGADAALLLAYHLASGRDAETRAVLENTLLILEPLMNPDGRARAVADLRGLAGPDPSFDDQELARLGNWPYGRFNHYGFDLNRDWIYASQPETRARIALLDAWRPLLFVDAHEMFPQDSFLFSPPRAPVNLDFPPSQRAWVERFSAGIAADFDRRGFVYYSGEWNEGWYPGYSDAWGGLRGAANLLFEQARVADHGVLQANREILSYGEAIARQLAASWASLRVLAAEREALLAERIAQRQRELEGRTRLGRSLWLLPPGGHPSRAQALLRLLELQGLKVFRSERPIGLGGARDSLGRPAAATLPAGTLVIPGRQALAPLAAALLDPDPRLPEEALREERRRLLREGASTIYDLTAWALPHMLGLPFVVAEGELPAGLVPARADDAHRGRIRAKAAWAGWCPVPTTRPWCSPRGCCGRA